MDGAVDISNCIGSFPLSTLASEVTLPVNLLAHPSSPSCLAQPRDWTHPSLMNLTAGTGFGLPMASIYASYFRGSLDIHNLPGQYCTPANSAALSIRRPPLCCRGVWRRCTKIAMGQRIDSFE